MRILPPPSLVGQVLTDRLNVSPLQAECDRLDRLSTRLLIGCGILAAFYVVAGIAYAIVKGGVV